MHTGVRTEVTVYRAWRSRLSGAAYMEQHQERQCNQPGIDEERACDCCERVFPTAERLAVRAKVHRRSPERPPKCLNCCRTFHSIDKLHEHQGVRAVTPIAATSVAKRLRTSKHSWTTYAGTEACSPCNATGAPRPSTSTATS